MTASTQPLAASGAVDDVVEAYAFEERDPRGEECLGGGVRIDDAIVLAEHENRMRQGRQQEVMLDGAPRSDLLSCGRGPRHAAASSTSS
jgi:hypothetical protein